MNLRLMSLACCMLVASCSSWETKKITTEDFLNQERYIIDITDVDTYPVFDSCDELSEQVTLQQCFEAYVTDALYKELSNRTIIVQESISDTVWIDFMVNEKGKFCLDSIHQTPMIRKEIPELSLWIYNATQLLPNSHPATKRAIPVKARFKLPIVLKAN